MLRAGGLPEVYFGEAEETPQLLYRRGVRLRRRHRSRERRQGSNSAGKLEPRGDGGWGQSGLVVEGVLAVSFAFVQFGLGCAHFNY